MKSIIKTSLIIIGICQSTLCFTWISSGSCAKDRSGWGEDFVCKSVNKTGTWVGVNAAKSSHSANTPSGKAYHALSDKGVVCNSSSPVSNDGRTLASGNLHKPHIFGSTSGSTCFEQGHDGVWYKKGSTAERMLGQG